MLADRLIHRLAIVAPSATEDLDDYGHPVAGEPEVTVLDGFLFPLSARDQVQANEAGAVVADHDAIFAQRTIPDAGYVRFDPDDQDRYEITGHEPHRFGGDPLVVVHLRRVVTQAPGEATS